MAKKLATMQREKGSPFRWVLTENQSGAIIDIDRYQNDLVERWEDEYEIAKIGS